MLKTFLILILIILTYSFSVDRNYNQDCARGQAESIIDKKVFPNSSFILNKDSISGIETVRFKNKDKLIINNWGCENYILTFRFETSRYRADIKSLKYWYLSTIQILSEIKHGLVSPIDIGKGINAMNKYLSGNVFDLKLEQEIDFGETEIRDYIVLNKIEKISKNRFAITVSFVTGPL